jgi:hypothetical protein
MFGSSLRVVRQPKEVVATLLPLLKVLVVLLVFLLPTDWFEFTGTLLREAGAKPAIPLGALIACISLGLFARSCRYRAEENLVTKMLAAVIYLGCLAFFINLLLGWSRFTYARSPFAQFASQSSLLILFAFTVRGLMHLMSRAEIRRTVVKSLPWVATLHLMVFLLEAVGFLDDSGGWLLWFRTDGGAIERPTGLTSEPSYFGTLAALIGTPLILMKGPLPIVRFLIAIALIGGAIFINAKTLFVVVFFQLVLLAVYGKRIISTRWILALLFPICALGVWVVLSTQAANVVENLSSAMRLGSNLLALNAALTGYGFTGVGIGQFHFFYTEEFAPAFLMLSHEAAAQMELTTDLRASTFNLFLRLFIETGVAGLAAFVWLLHRALKLAGQSDDAGAKLGLLLTGGSIGFLMTQDTYFYPPLAIGLALALTSKIAFDSYPAGVIRTE